MKKINRGFLLFVNNSVSKHSPQVPNFLNGIAKIHNSGSTSVESTTPPAPNEEHNKLLGNNSNEHPDQVGDKSNHLILSFVPYTKERKDTAENKKGPRRRDARPKSRTK